MQCPLQRFEMGGGNGIVHGRHGGRNRYNTELWRALKKMCEKYAQGMAEYEAAVGRWRVSMKDTRTRTRIATKKKRPARDHWRMARQI